jgi:hypothetical protein
MAQDNISGRAAIVGLGATEFSKNSGRTELRLALEATLAALADAGIAPEDVDGFSSYTVDKVPEYEIARLLGAKDVKFFSQVPHGGGAACAPVLHAAMAVATGVADGGGLPGDERAQLVPLRQGSYGFADPDLRERELRLVHAARLSHAGGVGGHVRPPLHARVRRHQRGLRPRGVAVRDTPPPTRPPSSTASRSRWPTTRPRAGSRAAAPAGLLPGERRCGGDGDHLTERARDLKGTPPVIDQGCGAGHQRRPADHDLLLPRRHHSACPRWAWWRASCGSRAA